MNLELKTVPTFPLHTDKPTLNIELLIKYSTSWIYSKAYCLTNDLYFF